MEPPPLSAATTAAPPTLPQQINPQSHLNYPDSVDSSPRSRNTDSWEDSQYGLTTTTTTTTPATTKLRLMCSYGGRIVPRPHDKSLCYVGGDTRIIVVDRHTTLSDLRLRLSKSLLNGLPFCLKYQLPTEDLDSLISVTTDEDLENMVEEYDRLFQSSNPGSKTSRLRLFLFPASLGSENSSSIESILEGSKNQDWFFTALNWNSSGCKGRAFSDTSSVNCLLGLDDSAQIPAGKSGEVQLEASGSMKSGGKGGNSAQDVHSVPDSPMLETTSSFGSSSSSPYMANLPPIKVHVEEGTNNQKGVVGLGIEEQFQQINVGGTGGNSVQKQEEGGGYMVTTRSPVGAAGAVVTGLPLVVGGEYGNRVLSDDERSDQGLPIGFRKSAQLQQEQPQLQQHQLAPILQHGKSPSGFDLPSPDSVSSESSLTNPMSRQKPMVYQEQTAQIQPGNGRNLGNQVDMRAGDTNSRMQMQQVQESGYVVPSHFDQYQQLHQPQQFVPGGAQYVHHHPPGTVPVYYSVYPSQQLSHPSGLDHPYPVYFMPQRQAQVYNMPPQQHSYSEPMQAAPSTRPQAPTAASVATYNPAMATAAAPASKPDVASGIYRTSASPPPQMLQVPPSQATPQYAGFSQIYHQPQTMNAAAAAATPNYAYELGDPTRAQVYYTQPLTPQLASQYQTMAQAPVATLSDASQLSNENIKQPVRTQQ